MSMMRKWTAAAVVFVTVLAACKDSTGPRPFSGTYVLAEIDGTGAPLVTANHTFSNAERVVYTIVYDTIQFTSGTTARRSESLRSIRYSSSGVAGAPSVFSASYTGNVQRDGDRVTITWSQLGTPSFQQSLDHADGTLEWQTLIGLTCDDNCPGPRSVVLTYVRP